MVIAATYSAAGQLVQPRFRRLAACTTRRAVANVIKDIGVSCGSNAATGVEKALAGVSSTATRPRRPDRAPSVRGSRVPRFSNVGAACLRVAGDTLPVFLPGSGQLLQREYSLGLFFLSFTGLFVALGWAVVETLSFLTPTLETLGLSRAIGVRTLAVLYVAAAVVHLTSVLTARGAHRGAPPPIVAGLASALVPGWGQFISGARIRAVVFLGVLWLIGAVWILNSTWTRDLVLSQGLFLPPQLKLLGSDIARFVLPAAIWPLAIYDAIVTAKR